MKILVADDDPDLLDLVAYALGQAGYLVVKAGDGNAALSRFESEAPDLVILDINMPGQSGFDVCAAIRGRSSAPVMMLTARGEEQDLVRALDLGADDYLTKPFAPKELSARIRALLRRIRPPQPGHQKLNFGDLELIPDEGKVTLAKKEVHLTKTEFRLLCELASNPGRVFSREALLDKVWGYGYFGDGRLVDVHIRRLRTKIEADPANPRHVVTVRGLGYRLQG